MTFELDSQCEHSSGSALANNPLPSQEIAIQEPDDRYPGSFFRIPGMPAPGSTWSLSE